MNRRHFLSCLLAPALPIRDPIETYARPAPFSNSHDLLFIDSDGCRFLLPAETLAPEIRRQIVWTDFTVPVLDGYGGARPHRSWRRRNPG